MHYLKYLVHPTVDCIRTYLYKYGRVSAVIQQGESNLLEIGAYVDQRHGYITGLRS